MVGGVLEDEKEWVTVLKDAAVNSKWRCACRRRAEYGGPCQLVLWYFSRGR